MLSKADRLKEELEVLNEDVHFYRENLVVLNQKLGQFKGNPAKTELVEFLIASDTAMLKEKEQARAELI